jgi:hypothetical protein
MGPEFLDGIPFPFEFFFGEKGVDLLVTGRTEADGLVRRFTRNIALVATIVVTAARNEVMTSQYLLALTQTAPALHGLEYPPAHSDAQYPGYLLPMNSGKN